MQTEFKMGGTMFTYNKNLREKSFFVSIPSEIKYNFTFLNNITELMKKVEQSQCSKIYFSCSKEDIKFDKMGAAYLYNTLIFFSRSKNVLVDNNLFQIFHNQVVHSDAAKFEKVDISKVSLSKIQQCYNISDDKLVDQTVQILVDFISDNNLVLKNAKEFLITTIGEIFTNAFGHSNERNVFFMYDIEWHDKTSYLVINITDYGKTIIHNVQSYFEEYLGKTMNSCACLKWAMALGNTTRLGSGGYGLPTLKDYVSSIKGELLIFSGDVIYTLKETEENILNSKGDFYGTSILMKIPLFDTSKAIVYDEDSNKIVSIDLDKI